jgi:hypothetical protein
MTGMHKNRNPNTNPVDRSSRRRRQRATKFAGAAVAATVALGGLVASAEPVAAAGTVARLTMQSKRCVTVTGHVPMGPYETHGYINNGARLSFALLGDDPGLTDDLLGLSPWATKATGTVGGATIYASDRGIAFEWIFCHPQLFGLNEDIIGDDEVYADVTIVDGDGHLLASAKTNTVSGNFGF